MKTLFRTLTPLAFTAALFLFSACEKDTLPVKPNSLSVKPHTAPSGTAKSCDPWRDVTGYSALITEINGFALCDVRTCRGGSTTITTAFPFPLLDSGGDAFSFTTAQTITPAEQNDVMAAGLAYAISGTPSGYFISQITYLPIVHTFPGTTLTYAEVKITVVYRMCTGGGGGEEG